MAIDKRKHALANCRSAFASKFMGGTGTTKRRDTMPMIKLTPPIATITLFAPIWHLLIYIIILDQIYKK
jgi:hypothetical protein